MSTRHRLNYKLFYLFFLKSKYHSYSEISFQTWLKQEIHVNVSILFSFVTSIFVALYFLSLCLIIKKGIRFEIQNRKWPTVLHRSGPFICILVWSKMFLYFPHTSLIMPSLKRNVCFLRWSMIESVYDVDSMSAWQRILSSNWRYYRFTRSLLQHTWILAIALLMKYIIYVLYCFSFSIFHFLASSISWWNKMNRSIFFSVLYLTKIPYIKIFNIASECGFRFDSFHNCSRSCDRFNNLINFKNQGGYV